MNAEYLTMAEIEQRYPNEWVVMDRPKVDRYQNLLGGYVVVHAPDRSEMERQLDELGHLKDLAIRHTSVRPFFAGPAWGRWEGLVSVGKVLLALGLLVGVGWASHALTVRVHVPEGVRIFDRVGNLLDTHANGVRTGVIQPRSDPNPNAPASYPITDELRRAGVGACLEHDGALWYYLPSHPLDGGSPCLVTPLKHDEPVYSLPKRVNYKTYHFQPLKGNWAYWFVLP